VVSGERIDLDLSRDVVVEVRDRTLDTSADGVELSFGLVGVPVSTVSGPLRDGEAVIDPGIAQRTISGAATATVRLLSGDDLVVEQDVGVDATQAWYLTMPFALGVLLLLLALANLESALKPLRSGHRRLLSSIGAFGSGLVAGPGLVLLAGALGIAEPTIPAAVGTAVVAAVGGVAAARARVGVAKRRRVRKAVKRAERTLSVPANAG
jgi:hypothetical protein